MTAEPRFLVVDGYKKKDRDDLAADGMAVAADLFVAMLHKFEPKSHCDVLFPSDPDETLPAGLTLSDYDGIAWTGCNLTIYDDVPEVRSQIELARTGFSSGTPSFGSCWATQIAISAAGGVCRANPNGREMGLARKISLTPEGRAHPMYEGKASVFDAFTSHVDEVTHLPAGAVVLAANAFTSVQAVSIVHQGGVFWSPQYHPEFDLHEMARLTYCRLDKLMDLGFFADREAGETYVNHLESLHQDPERDDIAWMLGIDDDIMNEEVRLMEVRNWIERLVRPTMQRRR
jgi:GMP synthase (glutamine-hydrolysing)